jgi:hypothetical protein
MKKSVIFMSPILVTSNFEMEIQLQKYFKYTPDTWHSFISDVWQHAHQMSLKSEKIRLKMVFQYVDLTWNYSCFTLSMCVLATVVPVCSTFTVNHNFKVSLSPTCVPAANAICYNTDIFNKDYVGYRHFIATPVTTLLFNFSLFICHAFHTAHLDCLSFNVFDLLRDLYFYYIIL